MIYRTKHRVLEDGCYACNMSKVYCDSVADQGRKCCPMCAHP